MNSTQRCAQSFKPAKYAVLTLLALSIGTGLASARSQSFKGKFTLPFEARWGQVTLPPAEYTFVVSSATASFANCVTVSRDGKGVAMIVPVGYANLDASGSSKLTAFQISGGTYRIRSLHLRPLGMTLMFGVPKSERTLIARAPESARVPILTMGK